MLRQLIAEGAVDTVVVAFPDLQGRPVGKRVTADFFVEHVAGHGIEACDYSFVDASTAAQVRPQSSAVTNENTNRPMKSGERLNDPVIRRRGFSGLRSPNN